MLQYLRLLLPDDLVFSIMVRGQEELGVAWRKYEAGYKHIVLIGHGSGQGLAFGAEENDLPGADVAQLLKPQTANEKKVYLSLACETGTSSFAKAFSQAPHCEALVAPLHSIHGAVAALFCHAFFGAHFLNGHSTKIAFNKAVTTPGAASGTFRFWQGGAFVSGAAK